MHIGGKIIAPPGSMKKLLLLSGMFWVLFTLKAKCDRIIFNGDTITLNAKSFLSKYPGFKSLQSKLVNYKSGCYDAEWTIIGHQLYLTNIYNCSVSKTPVKENINAAFHVNNRKVKANWVTKDFWFPVGKPFHHPNNFITIYKAETKASVVNGELLSVKRFNYTNSRESINDSEPDTASKFFAAHINWHKVPHQAYFKVAFAVQTGTTGKVENVKQIVIPGTPPHSPLYDAEARRIIHLLPVGIYYRHGKVFHVKFKIEGEFSNGQHFVYKRPQ